MIPMAPFTFLKAAFMFAASGAQRRYASHTPYRKGGQAIDRQAQRPPYACSPIPPTGLEAAKPEGWGLGVTWPPVSAPAAHEKRSRRSRSKGDRALIRSMADRLRSHGVTRYRLVPGVSTCPRLMDNLEHNRNVNKGKTSMSPTKLPGIVACTGAMIAASENSNPEALLTLRLTTEEGQTVLLPLSEQTTRQLQEVISQFNRTRDLLFLEERAAASATLQ